jgi:hypothetical protein
MRRQAPFAFLLPFVLALISQLALGSLVPPSSGQARTALDAATIYCHGGDSSGSHHNDPISPDDTGGPLCLLALPGFVAPADASAPPPPSRLAVRLARSVASAPRKAFAHAAPYPRGPPLT